MWTGRKLRTDYEFIYEIEVCCDSEKCDMKESKHHVDYIDERRVKSGNHEYSRFDMTAVKAVKITNKDRIHVRIMYLSEDQRKECLADLLSWIRMYGSNSVISVANSFHEFVGL